MMKKKQKARTRKEKKEWIKKKKKQKKKEKRMKKEEKDRKKWRKNENEKRRKNYELGIKGRIQVKWNKGMKGWKKYRIKILNENKIKTFSITLP